MDAGGRAEAQRLQVVSLEDVQLLDEGHAARADRRHGNDLVATVRPPHRDPLPRPIGPQVFAVDQPSVRGHLLLDERRGFPLVEPGRAALGDALERAREVGLPEGFARLVRDAVLRELRDRGGVRLHVGQDAAQRAGEAVGHGEAVAREGDGRLHEPLPGQLPVLAPGKVQPRHGAGHADRQVAVVVEPLGVFPVFEEHRRRRPPGSGFTEVVGLGSAGRRSKDDEAAAADVARGRMGDGKRERRGDGGIDGRAALLQNRCPHARGRLVLRDDQGVPRAHRLLRGGSGRDREKQGEQNPATAPAHRVPPPRIIIRCRRPYVS